MEFETKALHGGHSPKENKNCITVPIYQTTAFNFPTVQYAADLFDLKTEGDIYTRISNPTIDVLEKRIASIENGIGSIVVSSGQSAVLIAVMNIVQSGDEIISSSQIYGGTTNLFASTLAKYGVKTTFIEDENSESYRKAITPKTKCIYTESLGNPNLNIADIETLAKVAHENGIPLIVDNTVASPYLLRPIEHGADIIVHSTTKYINGHGNSMGGAIIDSGNFDWTQNDKFKCLTEPDASYHGLSYTQTFKNAAYIVKARVQLLRDLGMCMSPLSAYLTIIGLDTLAVRMERLSETALKVSEYLKNNKNILWVTYPKLQGTKYYELGKKYLPKGGSSLISFRIKGGKEAGVKFIENLKLLIHATNLGDVRSIITYPALTTHRQLTDEQMISAGISNDFMRLSVGLENVKDIIADIEQALNKACK